LYDAAIKLGWVSFNPAINVKPPVSRKQPATNNNYLLKPEVEKLISYLPNDNSLSGLRDRLLVALMVVCGARQIELHRLKIGDIERRTDGSVGLKLFAKRSERVIPLPPDIVNLLDRYMEVRKKAARERTAKNLIANKQVSTKRLEDKVNKQSPVFISLASNHYGEALGRRAMQIIANTYLEKAELKESESRTVTTHGLRHTVGYLMTIAGNSLRVIQDYLGHADPKTTAIYSHIADLWDNNPVLTMGIAI